MTPPPHDFATLIAAALGRMHVPHLGRRIRDGSQEGHLNILLVDAIQEELGHQSIRGVARTEVKRSDIAIQILGDRGELLLPPTQPSCVIEAKTLAAYDTRETDRVKRHDPDVEKLRNRIDEGWTAFALLWGRTYSKEPPAHWKYRPRGQFFSQFRDIDAQRTAMMEFASAIQRGVPAVVAPVCVGSDTLEGVDVALHAFLVSIGA